MFNAVKYFVAFVVLAHTTSAIRSTSSAASSGTSPRGNSDPSLNPTRTWVGGAMRNKKVHYMCRPEAAHTDAGKVHRFA